ncbi:hypothetical protein ACVWWO_000934 [Bradyrhizobium sp. F1.13.1]
MTLALMPETRPTNVVSFFENGTACVIFFPYAAELTEAEWKRIDAAPRIRFFLYACSDAQVPPGQSGRYGEFEDYYPVASVRSAVNRSTYMCSEILPARQRSRAGLVKALMNLAAKACSDDHSCAVLAVTDRQSLVDDYAVYRPHPRLKSRPLLRADQTSDGDVPVGGCAHAVR